MAPPLQAHSLTFPAQSALLVRLFKHTEADGQSAPQTWLRLRPFLPKVVATDRAPSHSRAQPTVWHCVRIFWGGSGSDIRLLDLDTLTQGHNTRNLGTQKVAFRQWQMQAACSLKIIQHEKPFQSQIMLWNNVTHQLSDTSCTCSMQRFS